MRQAWRRFVRLGVTADVSPSEARCVLLSNAIAGLCVALSVITVVVLVAAGVELGHPSRSWPNTLTTIGLMTTVPLLNRAGRRRAATLVLVVTALVATAAAALILGPSTTGYLYLLAIVIFPCFAFPAGDSRLVLGLSLGAAALFIAIVVLYTVWSWGDAPVLGPVAYVCVGTFLALLITIVGGYARILATTAEAEILRERRRCEEILDEVLPARVAARLRDGESNVTEHFPEVTVLVADIAGFTALAESMSPETLVRMLDEIVSSFDALCSKYEVEKIKTIGDAYVAAAGLTEPRDGGPARMIGLGTEMLATMAALRGRTGQAIDLRVGVATGPVVAGVVGKHKFSFEVWGEAATLAEQLQAAAEVGAVLASEAVVAGLGAGWRCTPAGRTTLHGREVGTFVVASASSA